MLIVKVGGGAAINLAAVAQDLAELKRPTILIHGANALRDQLAAEMGREVTTVTSISGVSSVFSDQSAIDLLMMAYAGLRNKQLVSQLQQKGVNAIGLSGVDGGLVRAKRNQGIRVMENGRKRLLRDLSGKPKEINTDLLKLLLESGYTPVLTVPVLDEQGIAVNTDNDEIVALLQNALRADEVVQLIEAPGLLNDPQDPSSLVDQLNADLLGDWLMRVKGRMRRKIMALKKLYQNSRPRVYIADGRVEQPIQAALAGRGTTLS